MVHIWCLASLGTVLAVVSKVSFVIICWLLAMKFGEHAGNKCYFGGNFYMRDSKVSHQFILSNLIRALVRKPVLGIEPLKI